MIDDALLLLLRELALRIDLYTEVADRFDTLALRVWLGREEDEGRDEDTDELLLLCIAVAEDDAREPPLLSNSDSDSERATPPLEELEE